MTSPPRVSKERKRVRASTASSDDDSECDRLTTDARPCQAERKRELERNRRNLINIRFSELDTELHLSSTSLERSERRNAGGGSTSDARAGSTPSHSACKGRRIDKEAVLKEASQRLAAQRKELSAATERIEAMLSEIEDLRAEKLELRGDKAYLRSELDTVREEVRRLRTDNIAFWQLAKKYWFSKNDIASDLIKFPMDLFARSRDDDNECTPPTPAAPDDGRAAAKDADRATEGKDGLAAATHKRHDATARYGHNVRTNASKDADSDHRNSLDGRSRRVAVDDHDEPAGEDVAMSDRIPTLLQSPSGGLCGKNETVRSPVANVGGLSNVTADTPPITQQAATLSGSPVGLGRANFPPPPAFPFINDFFQEDMNDLFKTFLPNTNLSSTPAPAERKSTGSPPMSSSPQLLGRAHEQPDTPIQSQSQSHSHSQSNAHPCSRTQSRARPQAGLRGHVRSGSQEQALVGDPTIAQAQMPGGVNGAGRWSMAMDAAGPTAMSSHGLSQHAILGGLDQSMENPIDDGIRQQHVSAGLISGNNLPGLRSSMLSPSEAANLARDVLSARTTGSHHHGTARRNTGNDGFATESQSDGKAGDDGFSDVAFCV